MRWSFNKNEVDPLRDVKGTSVSPATELHRSPGLEKALSHIGEKRRCFILDLGTAQARNVTFFSGFPCRLRIVDFLGCLADVPESAARLEHIQEEPLADLLAVDPQPVDLILAWNVFDHIELEAARRLASRLAQLTHPGARLHAMVSTGYDAEAGGIAFAIREPDTLEYRATARPDYSSVPFNPAAFAQLLEGFAIDHSVVLRHGFQEYVAVRI